MEKVLACFSVEIDEQDGFNDNDHVKGVEIINTDEHANCFSRLFFCWFLPLLRLGTKRELTREDLGKFDVMFNLKSL